MNVDQCPPASVQVRCSVCSSDDDMQTYTAPLVTARIPTMASRRNWPNRSPSASLAMRRSVVRRHRRRSRRCRRVGEAEIGERTVEHAFQIVDLRSVAAQQAMVAQDPHVAGLRDRRRRRLRNVVRIGEAVVAAAISRSSSSSSKPVRSRSTPSASGLRVRATAGPCPSPPPRQAVVGMRYAFACCGVRSVATCTEPR